MGFPSRCDEIPKMIGEKVRLNTKKYFACFFIWLCSFPLPEHIFLWTRVFVYACLRAKTVFGNFRKLKWFVSLLTFATLVVRPLQSISLWVTTLNHWTYGEKILFFLFENSPGNCPYHKMLSKERIRVDINFLIWEIGTFSVVIVKASALPLSHPSQLIASPASNARNKMSRKANKSVFLTTAARQLLLCTSIYSARIPEQKELFYPSCHWVAADTVECSQQNTYPLCRCIWRLSCNCDLQTIWPSEG